MIGIRIVWQVKLIIITTLYFFVLSSPLVVTLISASALALLILGDWISSIILLGMGVVVNWHNETFALNIRRRVDSVSKRRQIKILTYNLNRAYTTSINKGEEQEVADFIRDQDADIVLLQEFNPILYKQINEKLRDSYPFGSEESGGSRFKSVYSRYAIEDYQQLIIESEVLPICFMKVCVNGVRILVFNCHLMSNEFSVVYRELKNNNIGLQAAFKKMVASILQGYKMRQEQARVIVNGIRNTSLPVLICGDLNDVYGSKVLQILKKDGFSDAWWQLGQGFGFTYWGMKMRFRLDHILYRGKSVCPYSIKVVHSEFSDHRPIVATFYVEDNIIDN